MKKKEGGSGKKDKLFIRLLKSRVFSAVMILAAAALLIGHYVEKLVSVEFRPNTNPVELGCIVNVKMGPDDLYYVQHVLENRCMLITQIDPETGRARQVYKDREVPSDYALDESGNLYLLLMEADRDPGGNCRIRLCRYSIHTEEWTEVAVMEGKAATMQILGEQLYLWVRQEEEAETYLMNLQTDEITKTELLFSAYPQYISVREDGMCLFRDLNYNWYLGRLDGEVEQIHASDRRIGEDEKAQGMRFADMTFVGDEIYALEEDPAGTIYRMDGNVLKPVAVLTELTGGESEEYVDIINSALSRQRLFTYGDALGVINRTCFFVFDRNLQLQKTVKEFYVTEYDQFRIMAERICIPVLWGMLILGMILLVGNLLQWGHTLLARNMLVVPVVIAMFVVVIFTVSSEYTDEWQTTNSEHIADMAVLIAENLRGQSLSAIRSSQDDIQSMPVWKILKKSYEILEREQYGVIVLRKIGEDEWSQIFNSGNKVELFQRVHRIKLEEMKEVSGAYILEERKNLTNQNRYAISPVYDEENEIVGLVAISEFMYELVDYSIMLDAFLIAVFFLIILFVLIYLLTVYILRNLRKLSETVTDIAGGNYSARIRKLSKDELGEISVGVNNMAGQIQKIQASIITGMATMVESRDNSTGGHIKRTSLVVREFSNILLEHSQEFGVDAVYVYNVVKAAPMHDMGKIAVDDAILRKPGKFSNEEYAKMKEHAAQGAVIVEKILEDIDDAAFKKIAINAAHYHHEKWDGSGYPEGISGEAIPLEARIVALADVFDALVSKRCYKEAFDYDRAFRIMGESLGSHFDPKLGALFLSIRPDLERLYNEMDN